MAVPDFERLLRDNLELIDRIIAPICRRHRLTKEECQDFRSVLMVKLVKDDYRVLRSWSGNSSFGGYLKVVIHNAYRDHRNEELGKWRPPAPVRRLGPLAEKLYRMIDRDGMTVEAARAMLPPQDREEVWRLAELLPSHVKRTMVDVEQLERHPAADASQEEVLIARERALAFEKLARALAEAIGGLDKEDRVLVQLRMEEGVKLANLARISGGDARQYYRRWDLIVDQLRNALEANGYDKARVRSLLETNLLVEEDARAVTGPSSLTG